MIFFEVTYGWYFVPAYETIFFRAKRIGSEGLKDPKFFGPCKVLFVIFEVNRFYGAFGRTKQDGTNSMS